MSTYPHTPRAHVALPERAPRIAVPPTSVEMVQHASCVSGAILDDPGACFSAYEIPDSGTVTWSYQRSPGARYLRLYAHAPSSSDPTDYTVNTVDLELTISDGTTTITVGDTEGRIPRGWMGETQYPPFTGLGRGVSGLEVVGWVDLDALCDSGLSSSLDDTVAWSISVAVTLGGAAEILALHGWECPGFAVDPDAAGPRGVPMDFFGRDDAVIESPEGIASLVDADDAAVQMQRTLVCVAWRQQVSDTAETPSCASSGFGAITLLDEDGTAAPLRTRCRQIATASSAGESIRHRVLYRMSGGTTEAATVRLSGSATGSPWDTSSLAYTSSWTWSSWVTAAHKTNATGGVDDLYLEAKIASPARLWIASVHVVEAVAP